MDYVLEHVLLIKLLPGEWMPQNTFDDKSTLAQVMQSDNNPLPKPMLTHRVRLGHNELQ